MNWGSIRYRLKVTWQVLTCRYAQVVIRDWDGKTRAYVEGNADEVTRAYVSLFVAVERKDELNLPDAARPAPKEESK